MKKLRAKSNITEWKNSLSVEELNVAEKESTLEKEYNIESKATSHLIPMQSTLIEEIISKEKEEKLLKPSKIEKEKTDLNLILEQSKNITEVLLSNKEGKLRTIKPSKTNIKPKITTKEAILVKQISLEDSIDVFKLDKEKVAHINQDIVQNCSLLIEQNERLELEKKFKGAKKLDKFSAKTNLSESQLHLVSIEDKKTNESESIFEKSVEVKHANAENLKEILSHFNVVEIETNEKELEFKLDSMNLQNVKLDQTLREDQNLTVLEQKSFLKESTFDHLVPMQDSAKLSMDTKNLLEINQPMSLEKESKTSKLTLKMKKASVSQDHLNELHISDIKTNEKELLFNTSIPQSANLLPIEQANFLSNYNQQSNIAHLDERKAQGTLFYFIFYFI